MENAIHDEVRALMLSSHIELPEYAADPGVQRRAGYMLSNVSCRLFKRLRVRGPYSPKPPAGTLLTGKAAG